MTSVDLAEDCVQTPVRALERVVADRSLSSTRKAHRLTAVGTVGSAWRVAIIGGIIATVAAAVILRYFPGPSGSAGAQAPSGTILANIANGQIIAADASGTNAPASIDLQARARTPASVRRFDADVKLISVQNPWWDARARSFVATTSLTDRVTNGSGLLIDGALNFFAAEGQIESSIATSTSQDYDYPSVSPDGNWIAAQVTSPDSQLLHITVAKVSNCCRDARAFVGWGRPSWSPDSTRLAFQCSPRGGSPQLCIYDLRTSRMSIIRTPGIVNVLDPAWSPDARTIVAVANTGNGNYSQVVLIDTVTESVKVVTGSAKSKSFPQFNPSGDSIGYVGAGGVWIINLNSKSEHLFLKGTMFSSIQWVSDKVTGFGA